MKKNVVLITILTFVLCGLMSSCQVYGLIKTLTDKEEGRVVMKDGTEYTGRVKMPLSYEKNLRITTTDGKKLKLKGTEVALLGVWKKSHPDDVALLVYGSYKSGKISKKRRTEKPVWMALWEKGDYLEIYKYGDKYSITSSGTFKITSYQGGLIYTLLRKKSDLVPMCLDSYSSHRKGLIEYLADDPELCKKLQDREIKATDLEKIADEYEPEK